MHDNILLLKSYLDKLKRASELNQELRSLTRKYHQSGKNLLLDKRVNKHGHLEIFVSRFVPPPSDFAIKFGECFYNMRSALDHLVTYARSSKGHVPNENHAFPIRQKKDKGTQKFEDYANEKLKGCHDAFIRKVIDLEPYQGGDNMLYELNAMANIDEHRHLIAQDLQNISVQITQEVVLDSEPHQITLPTFKPSDKGRIEEGKIIFRDQTYPIKNSNARIVSVSSGFKLVFDSSTPLEGQPLEIIGEIYNNVEEVIKTLETEI